MIIQIGVLKPVGKHTMVFVFPNLTPRSMYTLFPRLCQVQLRDSTEQKEQLDTLYIKGFEIKSTFL